MTVIRWNPWSELFDLRNHVEFTSLPVDIKQTDESFVIEASVPGFRPEDVEVIFDDGVLTIRGNHTSETEDTKATFVRRERRQASLYRSVGLPAEVRADEISAAFDNGVLRVTVPRAQKAQSKRIPVTAGAVPAPTVIDQN